MTEAAIARIDRELALGELARLSPEDRAGVRQYVTDLAAEMADCPDCEWVENPRTLSEDAATMTLARACPAHARP